MKAAHARAKRQSIEDRLKLLQAQVEARKKKVELQNTITKAKADLKALRLSGRK